MAEEAEDLAHLVVVHPHPMMAADVDDHPRTRVEAFPHHEVVADETREVGHRMGIRGGLERATGRSRQGASGAELSEMLRGQPQAMAVAAFEHLRAVEKASEELPLAARTRRPLRDRDDGVSTQRHAAVAAEGSARGVSRQALGTAFRALGRFLPEECPAVGAVTPPLRTGRTAM